MIHNKFWQAFFALAPLLSVVAILAAYLLFLLSMAGRLNELESAAQDTPMVFFGSIGVFLLFIFLAVLLSVGSLVFYIVHAAQNPNLKYNNLLLVWILLFVFANGLGQLIYWIIEVVNKRQANPVRQSP
jgi:hypothetical protein